MRRSARPFSSVPAVSIKGQQAAAQWRREVRIAARNFEARWTLATLRRVDEALWRKLILQRDIFNEKCFAGENVDIEEHGAALVRGYAVAVAVCETAEVDDDACSDRARRGDGGDHRNRLAACGGGSRARGSHGPHAVWLTPDDVARMLVGSKAFRTVQAVSRLWPGAELLDNRDGDDGSDQDDTTTG